MLHEISVSQPGTVSTMRFVDGEKAKAAYDALTAALREHQLFKNDTPTVVEIDTNDGKASFKVADVLNVMLSENDPAGEYTKRIFEIEKVERAMRQELGLPVPAVIT